MLRKLTNLPVRAFLCPVCPPLCCFALAYIIRDVFSGDYRNIGMELAVKEQWWFGTSVYEGSFHYPSVRDTRVISAGLADCILSRGFTGKG